MDATENPTHHDGSPREKLLALERAVSERIFEREPEIRGFIVGLIARAHVLFLGPKGCAKSALGRLLCDLVAWNGVPVGQDPYFCTQLRVDSTTDEIFGPVSNEGFENDTFRRNTRGMVPEAKVALLEELYVAGSVLKSLLTILNESRRFYPDCRRQVVWCPPTPSKNGQESIVPKTSEQRHLLPRKHGIRKRAFCGRVGA